MMGRYRNTLSGTQVKKVLELVDDLLTAADNEDTPCVQAQERHKTKALTMYQVVNQVPSAHDIENAAHRGDYDKFEPSTERGVPTIVAVLVGSTRKGCYPTRGTPKKQQKDPKRCYYKPLMVGVRDSFE